MNLLLEIVSIICKNNETANYILESYGHHQWTYLAVWQLVLLVLTKSGISWIVWLHLNKQWLDKNNTRTRRAHLNGFKGCLRYKTITSQNMLSGAQFKRFFYFIEKFCSVLKTLKFFYIKRPHDLPNLWRHDDYQYTRQGAFLDISFKPQLIKSPNVQLVGISKGNNFHESFDWG